LQVSIAVFWALSKNFWAKMAQPPPPRKNWPVLLWVVVTGVGLRDHTHTNRYQRTAVDRTGQWHNNIKHNTRTQRWTDEQKQTTVTRKQWLTSDDTWDEVPHSTDQKSLHSVFKHSKQHKFILKHADDLTSLFSCKWISAINLWNITAAFL